ncbi:MAG: DNA repair protein RecN [Spirochaetaceae bacterium]|jgi:DNA repair protein RecN (Recombination protein N)|nr:DNA repair protein RecN [Spirochaetaceae bacterium]
MLEELSVRNYALIDQLSVSFENGLNILTGETGAGKSIIVGSLGFLFGGKADTDIIRGGAEEASVSAVISVNGSNSEALRWLKERDIGDDDRRVILRRNLKTSGRSSIFIQDAPVTRNDLVEFTSFLFDIHGQHSHQSLLRKESHRVYLDRFAGLEEECAEFNRVFLELAEKRRAVESYLASERDREARLDLLRYAVDEIAASAPRPGESRELEAEAAKLGDFEKLAGLIAAGTGAFFDDESSALGLLRRVKNSLEGAAAVDVSLQALSRRIDDLYYEADDAADQLRSYRDALSYDPSRLEAVEERLALLYRLKKKYGENEEAVLAYRENAETEIEALSNYEENRDKLKAETAALEKDIAARAQSISSRRREAAVRLGRRIGEILGSLGMPKAKFEVAVGIKGRNAATGNLVIGPWGADDVEFLISANPGEPVKDLARIASGGELSRVMLAIKTVLTGADTVETMIFDEIDTGIGGEVALSVGQYLAEIGRVKQIFCVTHLASIAVRADNHLMVAKKTAGSRTHTVLSALKPRERRAEIARMLAGDSGAAALAHADELLAKYSRRH